MSSIKDYYNIEFDVSSPERWYVRLSEIATPWAGIVYGYGKFSIIEPKNPKDNATMSFERDILFVPEHLRERVFDEVKKEEFVTLLGKILYDILQDNVNQLSTKDGRLVLELAPNDK